MQLSIVRISKQLNSRRLIYKTFVREIFVKFSYLRLATIFVTFE